MSNSDQPREERLKWLLTAPGAGEAHIHLCWDPEAPLPSDILSALENLAREIQRLDAASHEGLALHRCPSNDDNQRTKLFSLRLTPPSGETC
jgi:hypothetical protein